MLNIFLRNGENNFLCNGTCVIASIRHETRVGDKQVYKNGNVLSAKHRGTGLEQGPLLLPALRGTAQHGLGEGLVEQLEMRSGEVWLKRYPCYTQPSLQMLM